jgi:hypothetical protein
MKGVGSVAGSSYALLGARQLRVNTRSTAAPALRLDAGPMLAEQAPGGLAHAQLSRQAAASSALFHGEPGQVADASKETVEQVVTVNAYKNYMAVFRADDEVKASVVRIKA